jgi:hypothetical protein
MNDDAMARRSALCFRPAFHEPSDARTPDAFVAIEPGTSNKSRST